jgi:parallel beta-helix repeat protein
MRSTSPEIIRDKRDQMFTVLSVVLTALFIWNATALMQSKSDPQPQEKQTKKATVKASGRGFPRVGLQDGKELASNRAANNGAQPTALAAADFDSDGVADLVTADQSGTLRLYRGNADSLNPNSPAAKQRRASGQFTDDPFYSTDTVFNLSIRPDFLAAGDFNADGHKDILVAANGDSALHLLAGNGKGSFAADRAIKIEGSITALATGEIGRADGQTDVAVAVTNKDGAQLLVFEHPESAFKHKPEVFKLPAPATDIAIGNLDGDFYGDVAVACGDVLTIVHGRGQAYPWDLVPRLKINRPPAVVATQTMSFTIAALVVGKFGNQRGDSLALLGGDGNLYDLEPARKEMPSNTGLSAVARSDAKRSLFLPADAEVRNLGTIAEAPLSQEEGEKRGLLFADASKLKAGKINEFLQEKSKEQAEAFKKADKKELAKLAAEGLPQAMAQREQAKSAFLRSISARPSTLASWNLQTLVGGARFAGAVAANETRKMVRARVSAGNPDDILLLDSFSHQIQIITQSVPPASAGGSISQPQERPKTEVTSLDVEGAPTAILPMRLNGDALSDLVVLRQGSAVPSVVMTAPTKFIVVNSTSDGSTTCQVLGEECTLRGAIQLSNGSGGAAYIVFIIPGAGVHTISPVSPLPTILLPTVIDGATQPGYSGSPLIEISGANIPAGTSADGLKLRTSNAVIRGLAINRFPSVDNGNGSVTGGNGITMESTTLSPNNGFNFIERNFLGTDPTGTLDEGNEATGLNIFDSDNNQIGGTDPGQGNVMSGNGSFLKKGVGISVTAGNNNVFQGNIIGLNALGTSKVGNSKGLFFAGSNNTFGGDDAGAGNTVSGNGEARPPQDPDPGCDGFGMTVDLLLDADTGELLTLNNTISGNRLGTNPAGTQGFGNCSAALATHPLSQTVIGSITESGRNVVSDNGFDAIYCEEFFGSPTEGGFCSISGNNIGTDVTGTFAIPNDARNARSGAQAIVGGTVWVNNNLSFSIVGAPGGTSPNGACTGFCNLISGNVALSGVALERSGYGTVTIFNNFIGTNRAGNQAIPNDNIGVESDSSGDTYIGLGDPNTPLGNLISGNGGYGISAAGGIGQTFTFDTTTIEANYVGTDSSANSPIPNSPNNSCCFGGAISVFAPYTTQIFIGNTDLSAQNIISGNNDNGIRVRDFGGHTTIINNLVGLNRSLAALGNTGWGITLQGFGTQVGGATAAEANQIAFNGSGGNYGGVAVADDGFGNFGYGNTIRNNSIHDNTGLGIDLATDGVTINDECDHDADFGANMLQNFPDLVAPVFNGDGTVTVPGALKSSPSQHFTIDFYLNAAADPSGHGEGQTYLGATDVSTDTNGFGSFSFTSATPVSAPAFISATATDDNGNTSEFSCNAGQSCDGLRPSKDLKELMASPQAGCPIALIVNVTGDESDQNPNDGVCDIDTATPGLQCTLRAALEVVTKPGYLGPFQINFNIPGGGVQTITPQSALPTITHQVELNASTQPGGNLGPTIELRGDGAAILDGLVFAPGSDGSRVLGLIINRFLRAGIVFQSNNNSLQDSIIGLVDGGTTFDPNKRQDIGVSITGSGNHIGLSRATGNTITANRKYDVLISTSSAKNNSLLGNNIGLLPTGDSLVTGDQVGIEISQAASENKIGGTDFKLRNEIGGPFIGLHIADNATLNTVTRNQISNCTYGIAITKASGNIIGGAITADLNNNSPNIIASNDIGVFLGDEDLFTSAPLPGKTDRFPWAIDSSKSFPFHGLLQTPNDTIQTQNNQVQGNLIGMDGSGNLFPNRLGVLVKTATKNTIGGNKFAHRNYIGGNTEDGVVLFTGAVANTLQNNLIGLGFDGLSKLPNGLGVEIYGSQNKLIRNFISGNSAWGVFLSKNPVNNRYATGNVLEDNRIGRAIDSDQKVDNGGGVFVDGVANQIGDATKGNLISGNVGPGITIFHDGNSVTHNLIGTNLAGDGPLGNTGPGIEVLSSNNTIQSNTISGNDAGIVIGSDTVSALTGNIIQKNSIGTNFADTGPIRNNLDGITVLNGATNTLIGGVDVNGANAGNIISGNGRDGIRIAQAASSTKIQGNLIGTDKSGTFAIKNEKDGIFLQGANDTLIGGFGADIPLARNIISGNGLSGVDIGGTNSHNNRVSGNYIGTALDGTSALGNGLAGVTIHAGAHDNTVGGAEPNAGNTIASNSKGGVVILDNAGCCNTVDPNLIYGNESLGIDLGCTASPPDDFEVTDLSGCSGTPVPNDPGDADTGPNNLQNYPEFSSAVIIANGNLVIQYKVDSAPANSNYGADGIYIEFFKADPSLQGETFIGNTNYTAANYNSGTPGLASFNAGNAAGLSIQAGDKLVATATDADGNTSEFTSTNVGVVTGTPTAADGNISGTIADSSGAPVSGVTITLSGTDARETITDNNGSYRFDNVETNGFYTVMPARANYTFSPASRSFSLLGAHTEASFTASANGDNANAIDTTEFFVRQQYLDFLGREPDPPGFIGWVNTIRNCAPNDASCDRVHVSEMFFRSQEFQERGYYVYRFYASALGRKPDYAEFVPDLARMGGFLTRDQLEAVKAAFANDFVMRPEFAAKYNSLSNPQFVDTLLSTAGVTLSSRQSMIDGLNDATLTRAGSLRQIVESAEVSTKYFNQAFVVMEYFGYLRRDPDALYLNWIAVLDATNDPRGMVTGFVNSAEYRSRFGP